MPAKARWSRTCVALCVAACADPHAGRASHPAATSRSSSGAPAPNGFVWQDATTAPRPAPPADGLPPCGEPDLALARVAERVATREVNGLPQLDSQELAFALRVEGAPYVWPHTWTLLAPDGDPADVPARVGRFLGSFPDSGARRCGAARVRGPRGSAAIAVVVVDALADLDPVPLRARSGQWLRFDAAMRVPSPFAKLVVLGPAGPPKTVPTTIHDGHVRATWVPDRPGPWTAQLVATVSGGPRPILEALVFADSAPPASYSEWPAPGEFDTPPEGAAALRMLNEARATEGLAALRPDHRLEAVAESHALAMKKRRQLAHDLGDGDPLARLARAGISTHAAGENVAHALTLRRAHRALWASPSHRGNLLDPRFVAVGIGMARDDDGSVWLCEIFAFFGQTGNAQ